MKRRLSLAAAGAAALLLSSGLAAWSFQGSHDHAASAKATCTGSKSCRACKNCKYCKHCSKPGNSCGVCKP